MDQAATEARIRDLEERLKLSEQARRELAEQFKHLSERHAEAVRTIRTTNSG